MKQLLFLFLASCIAIGLQAQQNGLQFDGTNGSLVLCADDALTIGDGFTIEAWIFSPEWKSEFWQGSIVNKDQMGPDVGYALRAGKNGTLNFVLSVDNVWFETTSDPIMNTNQWYHVAVVIDENTVNLYINGTRQISRTFSGSPISGEAEMTIGESPGFPGRKWNGIIDEIRVWSIARTAQEVNDNQTTDFNGNEPGLVVYLPMNEGMGTTTANLGSITCNGSFVDLTESAWTDGYSIPAIDVGISAVTAPDVLSIYSRPVKSSVLLNNYGSESISDIPLELRVNGIPTLTGTFEGTLAPGESATYTFETPLDLTENAVNLIRASTTLDTDLNGLNNSTSYRYRRPGNGNNGQLISIRNREQHNFGTAGQARTSTINLPKNMEDYEQLLLHLSVECPNTGCDPWDQTGNISIVNAEGEFEIARFVTPYRIACGGPEWVVDVTDFKDLLSGTVSVKSFIQVFGQSGWLLNADLEVVKGDEPLHQKITPLWQTQYHVYGDPGIEDDLPAMASTLSAQTTESRFRLTMSGHGQGNTNNAAEFSNQTHSLMLNGELAAAHNLWKGDCLQNECSGQFGNWEFNRAGWCPGQAVQPFTYDLGGDLLAGTEVTFDYELQEYTNLLNTGYNNMGHTEPFYRITAYLVEESERHYISRINLRADSVRLVVVGEPDAPTDETLTLYLKNTGSEDVVDGDVAFYVDGTMIATETLGTTIAAGETMAYEFQAATTITDFDNAEIIAKVTAADDENISDDAAKVLEPEFTVTATNVAEAGVAVYPNPTIGRIHLDLTPAFIGGQLEVIDINGRVLQSVPMETLNMVLDVKKPGLKLLRFQAQSGKMYYQKVVVN